MTVAGVDPYDSFLVFGPTTPDVEDLGRSQVTRVENREHATSHSRLRLAVAASTGSYLVVVRDAGSLRVGWLGSLLTLSRAGAVAAVATYPDDAFADSVVPAFAALLVDLEALREVGGLEPAFDGGGQLEDALWRLAARGSTIARSSEHVDRGVDPARPELATMLSVMTANLETATLQRVMGSLLLAVVGGPLHRSNVDTTILDLQRSPGGDLDATVRLPRTALEGAEAVATYVASLGAVRSAQRRAHGLRRVSDRHLAQGIALAVDELWARTNAEKAHIEGHLFGTVDSHPRSRLLVCRRDEPGSGASPTLDEALLSISDDVDVRCLVVPTGRCCELGPDGWTWTPIALEDVVEWADCAILVSLNLGTIPLLAATASPVMLDTRDWDLMADLAGEYTGMDVGRQGIGPATRALSETLGRVDHVVTRDEEYRDVLLGFLAGLGRVTPLVYEEDHSLNSLVSVADDTVRTYREWASTPRRAADQVHSFARSPISSGHGR